MVPIPIAIHTSTSVPPVSRRRPGCQLSNRSPDRSLDVGTRLLGSLSIADFRSLEAVRFEAITGIALHNLYLVAVTALDNHLDEIVCHMFTAAPAPSVSKAELLDSA